MERYVTGLGKKALGLSQVAAVRILDGATHVGNLAFTQGNLLFNKARIVLADTVSVAKDSFGADSRR